MLDEKFQRNASKFAIFYILYTKTQSCFFHFSFRATLFVPLMNALVYVDIDQGIHLGNEKRKKNLHGFLYSKNSMAKFEAGTFDQP